MIVDEIETEVDVPLMTVDSTLILAIVLEGLCGVLALEEPAVEDMDELARGAVDTEEVAVEDAKVEEPVVDDPVADDEQLPI